MSESNSLESAKVWFRLFSPCSAFKNKVNSTACRFCCMECEYLPECYEVWEHDMDNRLCKKRSADFNPWCSSAKRFYKMFLEAKGEDK